MEKYVLHGMCTFWQNKHDIKKVDQLTLLSTTQKNRGLAISQVQLLVC
jgi:hypothetical protein